MALIIRKRPLLINITCISGFTWVIFSFPGIFAPAVKKLGDFYPALLGLIVASRFISLIGVWHMKRWGVNLFISVFFIKLIFSILTDRVNVTEIVNSVIFITCVLPYYKRMDLNL
jgi:hypothetical protein